MSDDRQPFDFSQAWAESQAASKAQHAAEVWRIDKSNEYAEAERVYRMALAKRITELRDAGQPATLASDLARGAEDIATLKETRDRAEGLRDAAEQSAWRHTADRRDLLAFIEWSARVSLADEHNSGRPGDFTAPVIGGRRAA